MNGTRGQSAWDQWRWSEANPSEPPVADRKTWRRVRSIAGSTLLFLGVAALVILAWPHQLGGRFGTTVVVGHSMDGTYATGDLLITCSKQDYLPGEVVVYSVSYAQTSGTVVHRITDERDGHFTTQGDNNDYPDPWPVTASDIRGQVVLHVPAVGWGILVSRTPLFVMFLTGALVTYLLWPRGEGADADDFRKWQPPHGPAFPLRPPPELTWPTSNRPQ